MKILIAEDDLNIQNAIKEILEEEGYQVKAASNGKEAFKIYQSYNPDFIILDIMMPEMSGYEVCREIRQKNTAIPILFLSAKSEEVDKVLGLEMGADDFVNKPFGAMELLARIRAVYRRFQKTKNSDSDKDKFTMADLEIYPREMRALRGEQSIDLGPRDIQILKLIYERKGEVISRNTLSEKCWDDEFAGTTRTIDQHISQLRKKIELDPKEPKIIQTIHGAGYRFE
jgi:DNA-binding response OmpR family regulator